MQSREPTPRRWGRPGAVPIADPGAPADLQCQRVGPASGAVRLAAASLGDHEVAGSSKLDQVGFGGKPQKPWGPLSTAGVVNTRDELTKGQILLPPVRFHEPTLRWESVGVPWGVRPTLGSRATNPTRAIHGV